MNDNDILKRYPPLAPRSTLVWTAIVDVGDREDLGPSSHGHRFMVPILGGRFYGGTAAQCQSLNGAVLPGGADRQLLRADGVKELDALYEMKIDEGPVITIHNRVLIDESRSGDRYAMSVIQASVERGDFDWINRRLLIGTLQSARPDRQAVIIRAWVADTKAQE